MVVSFDNATNRPLQFPAYPLQSHQLYVQHENLTSVDQEKAKADYQSTLDSGPQYQLLPLPPGAMHAQPSRQAQQNQLKH